MIDYAKQNPYPTELGCKTDMKKRIVEDLRVDMPLRECDGKPAVSSEEIFGLHVTGFYMASVL